MDGTPPGFQIGDRVHFKNKEPGNGIWNGELDTGLSVSNMTDITSMEKVRLQERLNHTMSKMLYMNHKSSYGTLPLNLGATQVLPL